MALIYRLDALPEPEQVIELYKLAGLPRPTDDPDRIRRMYENSNLIVSAWDQDRLVGVARSITDWAWSCYLADLAVLPEYQKSGVGKALIELTKKQIGEESMLLLLSVPTALEYYPKVGFVKQESSFIQHRSR